MKRLIAILLIPMLMSSCMINTHTIGAGAQGETKETKEMFYLIGNRISKVDTKAMAGDATDYEIKTEFGPLGFLMSIITFGIVSTRTVTVTK